MSSVQDSARDCQMAREIMNLSAMQEMSGLLANGDRRCRTLPEALFACQAGKQLTELHKAPESKKKLEMLRAEISCDCSTL